MTAPTHSPAPRSATRRRRLAAMWCRSALKSASSRSLGDVGGKTLSSREIGVKSNSGMGMRKHGRSGRSAKSPKMRLALRRDAEKDDAFAGAGRENALAD